MHAHAAATAVPLRTVAALVIAWLTQAYTAMAVRCDQHRCVYVTQTDGSMFSNMALSTGASSNPFLTIASAHVPAFRLLRNMLTTRKHCIRSSPAIVKMFGSRSDAAATLAVGIGGWCSCPYVAFGRVGMHGSTA